MSFQDTASLVGALGGLAGVASLIVSIAAFRRDRGRLRIEYVRNIRVVQPGMDDAVRQQLAAISASGATVPHALFYRDPDKTWGDIRIYNVGRRPLHIESVGFVVAGRPRYVTIPDFMILNSGGVALDEGKNLNQLVDQVPLETDHRLRAVYVLDAAGRKYYGGFPNNLGGYIDRLKSALRLSPFERRW